ncbi:PH domain-containing protein [Devriesea agamarum]|uniref:PH domain-containing protein n=1 Tax=Devriesea agamarum TaxID=472569 RepID=UPI001E37A146|nr:PH domain-containing protein [Devriesea agamarum]
MSQRDGMDSAPHPDGGSGASAEVVFRPKLARVVAISLGSGVLAVLTVAAMIVPWTGPRAFSVVDRLGFIALGLAIFWFCWRQATVRISARADGLTVRNLLRTTTLEWPAVVTVSFPEGDPWAHLDLADGTTLSTMALQRADGEYGIRQARSLQQLVIERGEAPDIEPLSN